MKSLDVIVLSKLLILQSKGNRDWSYARLAEESCLSVGETHASVKRLKQSRLYDEFTRSVISSAMIEFILYGLKYVYPGQVGAVTRGMATAHSADILSDDFVISEDDIYVWPYAEGDRKGRALLPLSKKAPEAASKDRTLYELLALIDAIRIGKARDRARASEKIVHHIKVLSGNGHG